MQSMKLYEIRQHIEDVLHDDNFSPEMLEALLPEFEDKVSNCIAYAKNIKASEEAVRFRD